ncbi:MAG: hypothetical protein QMB78_12340, partial [Rhodospirillales bacterium]
MTETIYALRISNNKRLQRERIFLYIFVAFLVIAVMFPFIWILILSFKPSEDFFAWPPKVFFSPTFDHYLG